MTGIFDDGDATLPGHRRQLIHIRALSRQMDREKRLDVITAPLQGFGKLFRADQTRIRIDICKNHLGTNVSRRIGGCEKRHRWNDDTITLAKSKGQRRQVKGSRSA